MNIANRLTENARLTPHKIAVSVPKKQKDGSYQYDTLTFRQLETMSNKFAYSLQKMGLKKGDRTLLFLRPSLEFSAMTFALFKIGIIPVFIDPGMGRENLLKCIKDSKPVGLIAEREVHLIAAFLRKTFKSVKFKVTNKFFPCPRTKNLNHFKHSPHSNYQDAQVTPEETAAILYTSGGTGKPKGVIYTHKIFQEQTNILQNLFHLTSEDVDLPAFPLFSLFTIAMGMTSHIPDMDPSKPGSSKPENLYKNIMDNKPTFVAGSPAIWEKVADYCIANKLTLPSIKYVVMFGAPVSVLIHSKFKNILPNGTTYTPYGATEALPVSNISGKEILEHTAKLSNIGQGTCIGKAVPGSEVKIIKISDEVIPSILEAEELKPYEVGEIIFKGITATKEYLDLPEKTALAKIYDKNDEFWHRMGDMGYIDNENRLWFLGRVAHKVITSKGLMTPISVEAIFNRHPDVKRSALVGIGKKGEQTPCIVIERQDGRFITGKERSLFENELLSMAKAHAHTKEIKNIFFSQKFPVDVRHNIKIDRKKLREEIEHDKLI